MRSGAPERPYQYRDAWVGRRGGGMVVRWYRRGASAVPGTRVPCQETRRVRGGSHERWCVGGKNGLGRSDSDAACDTAPGGLLWLADRGDDLLDGHLHRRRTHWLWRLCPPHE